MSERVSRNAMNGQLSFALVMDAGRIIERGNHAQLLAANGRYAAMRALQWSSE